MFVRVRINGRTFLLSEDEFMKLVLGMTPANPVDVLDFVGGRNRGERQHCRSPLFSLWVRNGFSPFSYAPAQDPDIHQL